MACSAAMFNRLKAMMELRMCVPICQLLICMTYSLSANSRLAINDNVARGNTARPSFSTGLLSVANNNSRATREEIIDAVLNRLKLKSFCCWKVLRV